MPTSMTTPISDITFSVVPVRYKTNSTPDKPGGTATRMMKGSMNDRNCATRIRYNRTTARHRPKEKLVERVAHALHHAAQLHRDAVGEIRRRDDLIDSMGDTAAV